MENFAVLALGTLMLGLPAMAPAVGWVDVVLLPALAFFIGLTIYAVWQRQRNLQK